MGRINNPRIMSEDEVKNDELEGEEEGEEVEEDLPEIPDEEDEGM